MIKLIKYQTERYYVSLDTVNEFEQTILSDSIVQPVKQLNKIYSKSACFTWKVLKRTHYNAPRFNNTSNRHFFSVLMEARFNHLAPYFALPSVKSIYMFDAWPKSHERTSRFINFFNIDNAFFSSSQVAESMQAKVPKTKCYWVPEGIDTNLYKYQPFEKKDIDVIALGRKYNYYHEKIRNPLKNDRKTYLYEKEPGKIIFPTREEFIEGMARSKISVCFPSSITHPERSGNIETLTIRYLQSMVSKCIIVGHAPHELIKLFGYNPVIEFDDNNPYAQIQYILKNYEDYFPLIEKNYKIALQNHTWLNRWNTINKILCEDTIEHEVTHQELEAHY